VDLRALVTRLSILTKDIEVVPFVPNWAQEEFLAVAQRQLDTTGRVRIITLKARQLGISTVTEAMLYCTCHVIPNYKAMVMAHEVPASQNLLAMTQRYWDTDPLKPLYSTKYEGQNKLAWETPGVDATSSMTVATAGNKAVGRSATIHGLHASEVAYWPEPKKVWTGLAQTIPKKPGTIVVIESTAQGVGNFFEQMWNRAVNGESEYEPLFFPWHRHPEYTAEAIGIDPTRPLGPLDQDEKALREMGISDSRLWWRRHCIRDECDNDVNMFKQEYPACVMAGTRIATEWGMLKVENVKPGHHTPYGQVRAVHQQPPTRCVRITTRSGLTLDCTWHHPMSIASSDLLVPAAETLGMDLVLADLSHNVTTAKAGWSDGLVQHRVAMTDDLALFAGYFMGDGYFRDGAVSIVCEGKDQDVVGEVSGLISTLGLKPRTRVVGSKGGGIEVRAQAKRLIDPFLRLGFARRVPDVGVKRHVQVPDIIWESTREHTALFLSGLFEADGFSNKAQWDVRLFTQYEQFARDVQLLLLGHGIHASVRGEGRGWVVALRGLEAKRFHERIGFRSARKSSNIPPTKPQEMRGRRLEVVSVEELGEHPSFDLSIVGRPLFGANGLLTHNTPEEAFISSGTNVYPHVDLTDCYHPEPGYKGQLIETSRGVHFEQASDGPLTIYRAPSADPDYGQYLVAGDPTRTTRGDFACVQVLNRRTLEQVAEWRARITPAACADVLFQLGVFYNNALITSEIEGPGYATIGALIAKNYPYIYKRSRPDATPGKVSDQHGWSTTKQSKHMAVGWTKSVIVAHDLTIHSSTLYAEMKNYVVLDNGEYGPASKDGFDDTVMAMNIAVACHMLEPPPMPYAGGASRAHEMMTAAMTMQDDDADVAEPDWMTWNDQDQGE